jgi:type II secretory pathway pseudopilin PulG
MTPMSSPGRIEGYALLDALVAILIASLVAGAALPGIGEAVRSAGKSLERATVLIEARNAAADERMGTGYAKP